MRDVWTDAKEVGVTVREVSRVLKQMERAGELREMNGRLYKRM